MTQFESIKQRMKDLVNGSSNPDPPLPNPTTNNTSASFFSISGNSPNDNVNPQQKEPLVTGSQPNAEEQRILAKIQEQNKLLEQDTKSLKSISSESSKSRRNSGDDVTPSSPTTTTTTMCSDMLTSAQLMEGLVELDDKTRKLWDGIIAHWDDYLKRHSKQLREHIRQGIPRYYRGVVWKRLCKSSSWSSSSSGGDSPRGETTYEELLQMTSPSEKLIRRDINRTYPEQEFFKDGRGQGVLFNVIKAYSLVDREVGYCQGSAFIAGLLLMHLPEEPSFNIFSSLMHKYGLRDLFKPSMAHLGLCMFQFECLLQEHSSELYSHFQQQTFHTSSFASSWFLTLMATTFDFNLASRILDVFISEGMEIIFRLGLAIILHSKDQLLEMDMEKMLMFVQKDLPVYYNKNPDVLFEKAYKLVKYNSKKMRKLEKDYNQMRSKEFEDQVEMRTLRTENRLLLQRVERLEDENQNLADKLIHDRVSRAVDAEERIMMEKELSIAKRKVHQHEESSLKQPSSDYVKEIEDQLVKAKLLEAESTLNYTGLMEKCEDLEERNRELTDESRVAELEAELIAVKLREAEANNAMKELAHKVNLLQHAYKKHIDGKTKMPSSGTTTKQVILELQEKIMKLKIKDTNSAVESAELNQKIMELETANHICASQLRRAEEDRIILREKCQVADTNKLIFKQQLIDATINSEQAESKFEETSSLLRLNQVEFQFKISELQQELLTLKNKLDEVSPPGDANTTQWLKQLEDNDDIEIDDDDDVTSMTVTSTHDNDDDVTTDVTSTRGIRLMRELQSQVLRQEKELRLLRRRNKRETFADKEIDDDDDVSDVDVCDIILDTETITNSE